MNDDDGTCETCGDPWRGPTAGFPATEDGTAVLRSPAARSVFRKIVSRPSVGASTG